ncbi:TPA: hypothetical protein QCU33_005318 [Bacillus cereus]|nr:hypothetical protein [Bacillus cereus]
MSAFKKLIYPLGLGLGLLPIKVFAHGEAEEPPSGVPISVYAFGALVLLLIVLLSFYIKVKKKVQALQNGKKKEDRIKRQKLLKFGWQLSLVGVVITSSILVIGDRLSARKEVYLEHVHGLGYSTDGKRILIPAHEGIKMYSDGKWDDAEGEKHDYMGLSVVDNGFYSSGHPAPGSDKKNPFGIVKSTDEGKTFQTLDLYGKMDFHNMAIGYKSHTIYVINPESNPRMSSTGLYYSTDDATTWTKSAMKGIDQEATALAVHPSDKAMVAIGTQSGVYLSKDYGQTFEKILSKDQATSLFFDNEGTLFVSGYSKQAYLLKLDIVSKKTDGIKIPDLTEDAIAYFAENPVKANEMAFATFKKDIYVSKDNGVRWTKIADQGKVISAKDK